MADARSPGQGNPLDSLPKAETLPPRPLDIEIQKPAPDAAMQQLLARRIQPARFQIAGVKSIPFDTVAAEFAPLTNRDISIAELLEAANRITQLYQQRGYPLSFAFVPAQTFKDNIVVVNVVEGYVSTVRVEGNPGASEQRLQQIAAQLSDERPLSNRGFERIAGVLGLQPGMRIKATIQPPTTTDGAAEMVLDVTRKPVTASVALDTSTSNLRGVLNASINGLTPLGEQVTVSTLVPRGPDQEKYYAINYTQPIRWQGMLLQVNLSRYEANPENRNLEQSQFQARHHTETERASINLSYPLVLTATRSLTINTGLYAVRNEARYTRSVPAIEPVVALSSDIRALSLELNGVNARKTSTTQWMLGLYQGIDGLGAKQFNNNIDLDFLRTRGSFSHSHLLGSSRYGITVRGSGQYSSDNLPLSEQISFGAQQFGIAYPAGEIAGDKGWGISLELNRAFDLEGNYVRQIQPYVLSDAARSYLNAFDIQDGELASFGIGVRLSDKKHYSLDLSLAQPVGNIPVNANKRSPRLNLSYAYQFE